MQRLGRGLAVLIMAGLLPLVPWVGVPGVDAATIDQLDQSQTVWGNIRGRPPFYHVRGSGSAVAGQTFTAGIMGALGPCRVLRLVAVTSGTARAALIKQYEALIKAQSGHTLTAADASTLIRLAGYL